MCIYIYIGGGSLACPGTRPIACLGIQWKGTGQPPAPITDNKAMDAPMVYLWLAEGQARLSAKGPRTARKQKKRKKSAGSTKVVVLLRFSMVFHCFSTQKVQTSQAKPQFLKIGPFFFLAEEKKRTDFQKL